MVDFLHKILVPQRSSYLVSRPRLNELLNAITDRRLITLVGSVGYGKTSLLIDFASMSPLPVCWYTLDSSDQDPWVFLEYLVESIDRRFLESTKQTRSLLAGYSHTSFASVVSALARDIYLIGRDFAIILDDWHLVDHVTEISEVISQLLLRCPNCHFILASRSYPSLHNIMLLAARRQMSSLDERQLRFTASEVSEVLNVEYDTSISVEQATALTEQANGWITGILLALQTAELSVQQPVSPNLCTERQVYRFLVEQVFDQQPPDIRAFLLDTALLEELTPEHCDTMFHRNDSRQLLETLLRRHLFITEIKPGVLRYHSLFREFLQGHYCTVDPERYRGVGLQIAHTYAAQGQWLLAFDRYVAAGQFAAARQVIASAGEHLYSTGRIGTLAHWFEAVPLEELDVPLLCLKARVLMLRGRHQEAQTLAQIAETRMQRSDGRSLCCSRRSSPASPAPTSPRPTTTGASPSAPTWNGATFRRCTSPRRATRASACTRMRSPSTSASSTWTRWTRRRTPG